MFFSFILSRVSWPLVNSLKVLPWVLTSDPKKPLKYQANSIIRKLHLSYGVLCLVVASPKPNSPTLRGSNEEDWGGRTKAPCIWTQHCWMLHVASVCTPCCMLLDVAACCCAKFETGQSFQPTTPNISFVPWTSKRSATMLDPFAQLFQHCWGHERSLRMDYKDLWVVFFPRCTAGPKLVGSCCIRLHTTANTNATTPNIVGATMLGVVAPVCTQP